MAKKNITFTVDEELHVQFQHALRAAAVQAGLPEGSLSPSVVLRQLLSQWIGDPRPPFDSGWWEGYRAAYAAVMRTLQEALHRLVAGGPINGLGVGMSSPYDERGDGT